jgi:ribonuclease P protein subunit POP4
MQLAVMSSKLENTTKSLLSRAHSPASTTRILTEKIKSRPLLLKPTEDNNNARHQRRLQRAQLAKRRKKLKPKPLSAREKRALCIYEIPKSECKYSIYEPLHRLWIGYIQEVLGDNCVPIDSGSVAKLVSADFHGAELQVVRSRCVSRVGLKGIVVRDSKFVFQVVTRGDELKIVPKEHTVFRFEVPPPRSVDEGGSEGQKEGVDQAVKKNLVFELHGDQFRYRAVDRANKKFKTHFLPDL